MIQKVNLLRLRKGVIEAFFLKAVSVVLVLLMHLTLANRLAPEGYGLFSYALNLTEILVIFVPLGFPNALLRLLIEYAEHHQWALWRGSIRQAHQLTLLSAIVISLFIWQISRFTWISTELALALRLVPILLLPLSIIKLRTKIFQAIEDIRTSIVLESITLPFLSTTIFLLLAATTATSALISYSVAAVFIMGIGTIWLWHRTPIEAKTTSPQFKSRYWLSIALPMVLGGVGQMVMNRTDTLMLGATVGMNVVGLYNAALRVARLNIFVLEAVNIVAPPMIARAYHARDHTLFQTMVYRAMIWSTFAALPMCAVMLIWPDRLLALFGTEFIQGGILLRVLALGQFINALTGPVGFVLLVTGHEKQFARIIALSAISNIAGNAVVIPFWGAIGAAIVTAITTIMNNGLMFIYVRCIMTSDR